MIEQPHITQTSALPAAVIRITVPAPSSKQPWARATPS